MWSVVAASLVGIGVGALLPWVLLLATKPCLALGLPETPTRFLSLFAAYSSALGGGVAVASISGRWEILVATVSTFAGLMLLAAVCAGRREREPERSLFASAVGFGTYFATLALLGAVLVST